ncbi:MAG: hypothetical protein II998_00300 [Clostridia bacterium]|nr:hypothetical protein [Clostridia bacterium]
MASNKKNSNNYNLKKQRLIIGSIIGVAVLVLTIVFIYLYTYYSQQILLEKDTEQMKKDVNEMYDKQAESAGDIKENQNNATDILGVYTSVADFNADINNWTYTTIELKEDGKATVVSAADGIGKNAWWVMAENGGVRYINMLVEGKSEPNTYQLYDSYLLDLSSVYVGQIKRNVPTFDSTFTRNSMEINIFSNGKAEGIFVDNNEESENKGLKYAMSGDYKIDGDFIEITLNQASSRFMMYSFESPDHGEVTGIASLVFAKQE